MRGQGRNSWPLVQALLLITTEGTPQVKSPARWSSAFKHFLQCSLHTQVRRRATAEQLLMVRACVHWIAGGVWWRLRCVHAPAPVHQIGLRPGHVCGLCHPHSACSWPPVASGGRAWSAVLGSISRTNQQHRLGFEAQLPA